MNVLVIGGGASGMIAAIAAAAEGASVTIYEHRNELGKKILATGNGKCNLTNRELRLDQYNCSDMDLLNNYFTQFDSEDTIATFRSFGLIVKDRNGYIYPACEQASVVRDLLVLQLQMYEVNIHTSMNINSVIKTNKGFDVEANGTVRSFDKVILACGSYAGLRKTERIPSDVDGYSLAYHLGHRIVPVKPALTALICKEDFFKSISGVRCECLISLTKDSAIIGSEYGELQITEYGVSGIPVFQLSRHVAAVPGEYSVVIDFMPGVDDESFIQMMQTRILSFQGAKIKEFFLGILNNKLNALLISLSGLQPDDIIDDSNRDALIEAVSLIKCLKLDVKGTKSFENAQCCSGGVPLSELDDNCQSVKCPGLYIAGEMIDVDGKCGGYNLQWAWTTGYIAGKAAGMESQDIISD